MTDEPRPGDSKPDDDAEPRRRGSYFERRRDKIRAEIERNRRGEYTVPTWVLVLILIAVVAGWAAIIIFA